MGYKINKIYEVQEGFHIDLSKIFGMRQFIDIEGHGRNRYQHCWIEIETDYGQTIPIDCTDIENLQDTYNLILRAWESYANSIETS